MFFSVKELFKHVELMNVEDAPSALYQEKDNHLRELTVFRLGNLASMGNRNNSEFLLTLNTCISTTLDSHNTFLIELRQVICIPIR